MTATCKKLEKLTTEELNQQIDALAQKLLLLRPPTIWEKYEIECSSLTDHEFIAKIKENNPDFDIVEFQAIMEWQLETVPESELFDRMSQIYCNTAFGDVYVLLQRYKDACIDRLQARLRLENQQALEAAERNEKRRRKRRGVAILRS